MVNKNLLAATTIAATIFGASSAVVHAGEWDHLGTDVSSYLRHVESGNLRIVCETDDNDFMILFNPDLNHRGHSTTVSWKFDTMESKQLTQWLLSGGNKWAMIGARPHSQSEIKTIISEFMQANEFHLIEETGGTKRHTYQITEESQDILREVANECRYNP